MKDPKRILLKLTPLLNRIPDFCIRRKRHRCLVAVAGLLLFFLSLPVIRQIRDTGQQLQSGLELPKPIWNGFPVMSVQLHHGRPFCLIQSAGRIYRMDEVRI